MLYYGETSIAKIAIASRVSFCAETLKHLSPFKLQTFCRYAVVEQRQPLFLHPERQHAYCSLDMGHLPPGARSRSCAERSDPRCCLGPYMSTPRLVHGEPASVHVDAIRCLLRQHSLAEFPDSRLEMELSGKLPPPQGP